MMLNLFKFSIRSKREPEEEDHGLPIDQDPLTDILLRFSANLDPLHGAALMLAAVPYEFDAYMISDLRQKEDGQTKAVMERLQTYAFIESVEGGRYRMHALHRNILRSEFIARDRDGFLKAQARAVRYWESKGIDRPQERIQNIIYHGLLAGVTKSDPTEVPGLSLLLRTFYAQINHRALFQIESLLKVCEMVRPTLVELDAPWINYFDDVRLLLQIRFAQLNESWDEGSAILHSVLERKEMAPALAPYFLRTHGDLLQHQGNFVGAIELYRETLKRIDSEIIQRKLIYHAGREWEILEAERAATMIALGDAHVGLAAFARGDHLTRMAQNRRGVLGRWLSSLFSLPIIFYLFRYFGFRVFSPKFWVAIGGEDWIILRLFGHGYRWYRKSLPVVKRYGSPTLQIQVVERQAQLFLQMGDWRRAIALFGALYRGEVGPLSDHHRAKIALGLAEAWIRQRQPGRAYALLNETLPVFIEYKDVSAQNDTYALIGESGFQIGKVKEAITALGLGLRGYEAEEKWENATNLAEYIQLMLRRTEIDPILRDRAQNLTDSLLKRAYGSQYLHPGLNRLWLGYMVSFAWFVFAIPLLILNFSEQIGLVPHTAFVPAPLFDIDRSYRADISESLIESLSMQAVIQGEFVLAVEFAIILTLIYLGLAFAVGFAFILFTSNESVQETREATLLFVDHAGLTLQKKTGMEAVPWGEIEKFVHAGLAFVPKLPMYAASFGLISKNGPFVVRAQTNWYGSLKERVLKQIQVKEVKLNQVLLFNPWMLIYLIGFLLQAAMAGLSLMNSHLLFIPLFDTPYRFVDLYPYTFSLLILPPLAWLIFVRWRQRIYLRPTAFWPWSLVIASLILLAWQIGSGFRPFLTVPDIYPPLVSAITGLSGVCFILFAKHTGQAVYAMRTRLIVFLLLGMILFANGYRAWHDVVSYHYLVLAKAHIQAAQEELDPDQAEVEIWLARDYFLKAKHLAHQPAALMYGGRAVYAPIGLPSLGAFVDIQAIEGIGSTSAYLGRYEDGLDQFSWLLRQIDDPELRGRIYGWIGITREMEKWTLNRNGVEIIDEIDLEFDGIHAFDSALDLTEQPALLISRGVAHYQRGEVLAAVSDLEDALVEQPTSFNETVTQAEALIGLGWIRFEADQHATAMLLFDRASQTIESGLPVGQGNNLVDNLMWEALVGMGYAAYQVGQYDLAKQSMVNAQNLNPDQEDITLLVGLASVHWRLGIHAFDPSVGIDVCRSDAVDSTVKRRARGNYQIAISHISDALDVDSLTPEQAGELYRFRAGMQLLLSNCPGEDVDNQLEASVVSMNRALEIQPFNGYYYQLRANYRLIRWENRPSFSLVGERKIEFNEVLFEAYEDIYDARRLSPELPTNDTMYSAIISEINRHPGQRKLREYLQENQSTIGLESSLDN